tara:strand:- start:577 stop:759 length:183 start_codon:yes stop_codon:yes gene_type:complete
MEIEFTESEIEALHSAIGNIPPMNSFKGQVPINSHTLSAWQKLCEARSDIFRQRFKEENK